MPDSKQAGTGAPDGAGLGNVLDGTRDLAAGVGAAGRDAALQLADQYKASAADRVDEAASLIEAAAGTAEKVGPPAARTVRQAETIVRGTADALRRASGGPAVRSAGKAHDDGVRGRSAFTQASI